MRAAIAAIAAAWPAAASAEPAITTAEDAIAAYDAEFDAVMASARTLRRCPRDADGEDIVVCGRADDSRMRVPYQPEPGARQRLIAGEAPSAAAALSAGSGGGQSAGIDVIGVVNALGRGLDRILHPD
jgi:hypothetical protein